MKTLSKKTVIISICMLALGLLAGWILFGGTKSPDQQRREDHNHTMEMADESVWTCSMHPQIRSHEPGKCPICGMTLVPLKSGENSADSMAVSMSPTAMQLANIQTVVVGLGNALKSVRLEGKVQPDERLLFTQSSHIPGRIEKLMVNFTGDFVKKGQVIAYIYSPELVNAQEELLEAYTVRETQPTLFSAAKKKLKNWKLPDRQINQIIASKKTVDQFPVLANASGFVRKKMVNLGDYVKRGQAVYEISNLSRVWVLFDIYESDIAWIKEGDKITYTFQALPGESFTGVLSYIDPTIDLRTRVAKARIEVSNKALKLKPEMFASGIVEANIGSKKNTVVIPKTAVMWTGKRSVIYVKSMNHRGISFTMREVTLGPKVGDSFVIETGLQPGEEIAVNGTFSIDAAAQLMGKPSMMNREGGKTMNEHHHMNRLKLQSTQKIYIDKETKKVLQTLFDTYFKVKIALGDDNFKVAKEASIQLKSLLDNTDMDIFQGEAHTLWMKHASVLNSNLSTVQQTQSIATLREQFIDISSAVIAMAEGFGSPTMTLYIQYCPMVNANKGASWLSMKSKIMNPYFGKAMYNCGKTTKTLSPSNDIKKNI